MSNLHYYTYFSTFCTNIRPVQTVRVQGLLYRVYLKCLDRLQEWIPYTKKGGKSSYQCVTANGFRSRASTFARHQFFVLLSVGALTIPNVFSSNWKQGHTSPTDFFCPSNHSQRPRDLRKGATVHERRCWCVHQVEIILSVCCEQCLEKQLEPKRLGTCTVNVSCQL